MRAVWLTRFGGPEVLVPGDAPDPVPGAGQVLVEVEYANVTFVETQFRATGRGPFSGALPMVPGNGVGGIVRGTGQRVVSGTGGAGGYAELAAVDAAGVYPVPDDLPMDVAVALLADGRTATMLVQTAKLGPGQRVLVEAAAGGVGSLLVQLARDSGATVVAVAGGTRKVALAEELGAQVALDYLETDWPDRVRHETGGLDVVFDGVGGAVAREAFALLEPGGRMYNFGLASGAWADIAEDAAAARGVTLHRPWPTPERTREYTIGALRAAAEGRLRPVIGQRFPLERAADAHAAIESRATVGKTLLVARGTGN